MSANLGESVRLGRKVCEEDSAVTLRASDGKMRDNQPVVAMSYDGYNQTGMEEVMNTMRTLIGGGNMAKVAIKQSYGINPQCGQMLPFDKECGETLAIGHQGGVMTEQDISQMKYIVRRLTPVECERLMGLPDGWTIPKNLEVTDALVEEFREKHDTFKRIMWEYSTKTDIEGDEDENGDLPKATPPKPTSAAQARKWLEKITNPDTCPDAPRYKACGNGWATNQPRWILTRLLSLDGVEW